MIKANVYIDHYGWQKKLKDPKKYINKKIKKASKVLGSKNKEFSILLTSNLKMKKLNNFEHEFDKIWIHGYLHLLGYDHKKVKDYNKMRKREELIFNYLNKKI